LAVNISGALTYCPGGSTTITASGGANYIWNDVSNSTTAAITVTLGTYSVTASDLSGCTGTASTTVTELLAPVISISTNSPTCNLSNGDATASISGGTSPYDILWSGGQGTATISNIGPGSYTVVVTDASSCTASQTTTIGSTNTNPVADFTLPDTLLCTGSSITLDAEQSNAVSYLWSNGATTPQITVNTAGTFGVIVNGACNTVTESATVIFESCSCDVALPSAFTPNGDGVNDVFDAIFNCGAEINSFAMRVFNRWGEKVFETNDVNGAWDGTFKGVAQPLQVYTYFLNAETVENNSSKSINRIGSVTIIR
jgi:gliding motility-associated-like protein